MRRLLSVLAALVLAPPAAAQVAPLAIEAEPSLLLGSGTGGRGDQFGLVVAAVRTADGGIAVLDALQAAVKIYDSEGRHLRDLGQRGDGPGEFRDPVALIARGDSLVVLDRVGRRAWIDDSGTVLDTDRLSIEPLCGADHNARYGGLLPDASLVVRCEERLFGRVTGEYRQEVVLLRVPRTGGIDSLGSFPADTGRADARGVPVPRPYSPGSPLLWAAAEGKLFVAGADVPEVKVLAYGGELESALRLPLTSRATTPGDARDEMADALRIIGNANDRRVVGEWHSEMPERSRTPVLRALVAASPTELWIESWELQGDRSWWLVADVPSGSYARALAPPRSKLLAAGTDWTLWLWRDEFDVEHVRMHALERR